MVFEDKNLYFSDLHYELSHTYLSFGNYRKFLQHLKISIEKNPNIRTNNRQITNDNDEIPVQSGTDTCFLQLLHVTNQNSVTINLCQVVIPNSLQWGQRNI